MTQPNIASGLDTRLAARVQTPQVVSYPLRDDGRIPNNEKLPLLVYQNAIKRPEADPAAIFEQVFAANKWTSSWRNGIYPFHHYHSTSHEVLGISCGSAKVQFGGEPGVILRVGPGDVVVIPAGVGHKNLGASADLCVVGAYPGGGGWDLCRGESGERAEAIRNIARVPLPKSDPVYGTDGPLMEYWTQPG